jgi:hypothetical protein
MHSRLQRFLSIDSCLCDVQTATVSMDIDEYSQAGFNENPLLALWMAAHSYPAYNAVCQVRLERSHCSFFCYTLRSIYMHV